MLSEQIVQPEPKLAVEFENKLVCHICDDELERPSHWYGFVLRLVIFVENPPVLIAQLYLKNKVNTQFIIELNLLQQNQLDLLAEITFNYKRRKTKDEALHPVCEYCERIFIERILILSAKKQREELAISLESANVELANKRQQLYSFKNLLHSNPAEVTSEQKIQKLDEEIIEATYQKNSIILQLQEVETQKIELKQSNIEKIQSIDIKQVKLQETTNKAQKSKDELEDIQRQIDEFLANLPMLDAEQKSALTQLDFSNYEQIFRGSNLPELMNQQAIKQSQIGQQPNSKKKPEQKEECNIF